MSDEVKTKQRGGVRSTTTADINKILPMLQGTEAFDVIKLRTTLKRLEHKLERLYKLDDEIQQKLSGQDLYDEIAKTDAYTTQTKS